MFNIQYSPLQFPGRLQQNTHRIIEWLSPDAQQVWFYCGIILFLTISLLAVMPLLWKRFNNAYFKANSRWLFAGLIILMVLLLRLPNLVLPQLNVDESQWIAGAATTWQDPRFWISVDGTTSGPLIIMPLNIINILGGKLNYASVRLLALLLMVIPTVLLIYGALDNFFGKTYAKTAIVPLLVAFSAVSFWDFTAYNSEHTPFTLVALALFFSSRLLKPQAEMSYRDVFFASFCCGLVPFSKLQGAPIAFSIALVTGTFLLIQFWKKKNILRNIIGIFILSGILPLMLVIIYLITSEAWHDFLESYILNNLAYTREGLSGGGGQATLWEKFRITYYSLLNDYLLPNATNIAEFLRTQRLVLLVLIFPAILAAIIKKTYYKPLILGAISLLAAFYSISQPGNYFPHYFLLLLPVLGFFTGSLLCIIKDAITPLPKSNLIKVLLAVVFLYVAGYQPLIHMLRQEHMAFSFVNHGNRVEKGHLTYKIQQISSPGEPLAIWGWANHLYIEAEMIQGTREAHTYHQINESPQREYYQRRYISDLERSHAPVFVDVVAPGSFFFTNTRRHGHQAFPIIKNYIDSHYTFLLEHNGMRLFVRNERKKAPMNSGQ